MNVVVISHGVTSVDLSSSIWDWTFSIPSFEVPVVFTSIIVYVLVGLILSRIWYRRGEEGETFLFCFLIWPLTLPMVLLTYACSGLLEVFDWLMNVGRKS